MARQPFRVPPKIDHSEAVLWAPDGTPILVMSGTTFTIMGPDDEIITEKLNSYVQLGCGTLWNPGMLKTVPVGVCSLCRKPPHRFPFRERPTHGVVTLGKGSAVCAACGTLACNRHLREFDGEWLCIPCFRSRRRLSFVRHIFFRERDNE